MSSEELDKIHRWTVSEGGKVCFAKGQQAKHRLLEPEEKGILLYLECLHLGSFSGRPNIWNGYPITNSLGLAPEIPSLSFLADVNEELNIAAPF